MQKKGLTQILAMIKAIKKRKANNQLIVGIPKLLLKYLLVTTLLFTLNNYEELNIFTNIMIIISILFVLFYYDFNFIIAYSKHLVIYLPLKCNRYYLFINASRIKSYLFTTSAFGPVLLIRLYRNSKPIRLNNTFETSIKYNLKDFFYRNGIPESNE